MENRNGFLEKIKEHIYSKIINLPTNKDYQIFLETFSKKIQKINGIDFYCFGSKLRNDFVPGVSDIDGFLLFQEEYILDKINLIKASKALAESKKESNFQIDLQFSVLDKGNLTDGRFSTFPRGYIEFFKNTKLEKLTQSQNYFSGKGFDFKQYEVNSIAHNLNKMRQRFLTLETKIIENDFDTIQKTLQSPIKTLSKTPQQIKNTLTGKTYPNKKEALQKYLIHFPNFNTEIIEKAIEIQKDPIKYNSIGKNFEKDLEFSLECLTSYEEMIKEYVFRFPFPQENEVRD